MGAAADKAGKTATASETSWSAFKRRTGIEDPVADAEVGAALNDTASTAPRWLAPTLLVAMYGVAVLVYTLLGHQQPLPQVSPDEYQYAALARSFADGHGLTYNGGSIGIRAALYIYTIAPAWLITDSLTHSYAIAKGISAALLCTVVFPTWVLARRFMPPLVALIPAFLVLAGSWMTSAGQLIMENLAFPLAAASLTALVLALLKPGSRAAWIAFAFALLATWARAQLGMLLPVILVALIVDVALQGDAWRDRMRAHRSILVVLGALCVVGGILIVAAPTLLGSYAGLTSYTQLGKGLPQAGRQSLAFVAMSAVLPFILGVSITLRRRNWDQDQLRALLVVFWVTTSILVLATGFITTAFHGVDWGIQRYVEYSLPLLYVLVIAGIWRGALSLRLVAAATLLTAGVLAFTPQTKNIQEQRGSFGLVRRSDQLLGVSPGLAMALIALILGAGTLVVMVFARHRSARVVVLATVVGLTGIVFAVQNQAGWTWQIDQAKVWREGFPRDLSWIDHATDQPLARLVAFYNPYRTPQTEVFNRRIARTYVAGTGQVGGAAINGFTCGWGAGKAGTLTFGAACGPTPHVFFLNDDLAKLTFYDQRVIAQRRDVGRVVAVDVKPPAKPRLKATVLPPCTAPVATQDPPTGRVNKPAAVCASFASGTLYLDRPATIVLRFRGGQNDQRAAVRTSWDPQQQQRVEDIPARQTSDITLRSPAGNQLWRLDFDWEGAPPAVPALVSVLLKQGGTTTELLY